MIFTWMGEPGARSAFPVEQLLVTRPGVCKCNRFIQVTCERLGIGRGALTSETLHIVIREAAAEDEYALVTQRREGAT